VPELQDVLASALDHPVSERPPVEEVGARFRRIQARRRRQTGLAALAVVAVGLVALPPMWRDHAGSRRVDTVDGGGPHPAAPAPTTSTTGAAGGPHGAPSPSARVRPGTAAPAAPLPDTCPATGATDVGVTATSITVFMAGTEDGPTAAVAAEADSVVRNVIADVNRHGGICGRTINLRQRITNGFAALTDSVAAISGPLQTDLDRYITDGSADRNGVPVIATDGLTAAQYRSPWVWPVGQTMADEARIAVRHSYQAKGARTFALVATSSAGDSSTAGVADAFRAEVASLPGASVVDANACTSGGCDAAVWELGSDTAWQGTPPPAGRLSTDALGTVLWDDNLAQSCAQYAALHPCDTLEAWDAFTPPVGALADDPDVAAYSASSKGDVNPLSEGAYVGAMTLIDALRATGPVVTRARLRAALDAFRSSWSLTAALSWGPTRAANRSARALRYANGGWADGGTGWVAAP
jgi:hypothetical protein